MKHWEIPEGTFTATGLDLLPKKMGLDPRPATSHIALEHVEPAKPSRWRRLLIWLGLADD